LAEARAVRGSACFGLAGDCSVSSRFDARECWAGGKLRVVREPAHWGPVTGDW
jgi:hypothetical protein